MPSKEEAMEAAPGVDASRRWPAAAKKLVREGETGGLSLVIVKFKEREVAGEMGARKGKE